MVIGEEENYRVLFIKLIAKMHTIITISQKHRL